MRGSSTSVRRAESAADVAGAFQVRYVVFVEEQGVPVELERDDRDATADHVVAVSAGAYVGAGRLVVEEPGYHGLDVAFGPVAHLGRLAVLPEARGSGVGAQLVRAIEERSAERGLMLIYLGAQSYVTPFYERLGYAAFGEEFDDAGLPHRHMWRIPRRA